MCDQNPYADTVQRITGADLPPATERFAVRLLAKVNPDCGYVDLTWEELEDLTGITNRGAARRHLTRMKQARIAHYDTNDYVYVTFFAWPDAPGRARGRADGRVGAPESNGDPVAETSHKDPKEAFGRVGAPAPARGRAKESALLSSKLVGSSYTLLDLQEDQEPTNLELVQAPGPEEVERSLALLTDPELAGGAHQPQKHQLLADKHARKHRFPWLVQQVAAYLRDLRAGRVRGIGALHKRIDTPFRLEPFDDAFLASPLYRRHYPLDEDEIGSWQRWQKYGGDEYADVMGLDPPDIPPEVELLIRQLPLPKGGGA